MSITPAFSPGPWITQDALVGSVRRWIFEDLYEQCSFHMAEKMPSSVKLGVRPISFSMRSYSSRLRPCAATSAGVTLGSLAAAVAGRGIAAAVFRAGPAPDNALFDSDLPAFLRATVEGFLVAFGLDVLAMGLRCHCRAYHLKARLYRTCESAMRKSGNGGRHAMLRAHGSTASSRQAALPAAQS